MTEIHWRASSSVSALYTASGSGGRQLTEARLVEALAPPTERLVAAITAAGFSDEAFWRYVCAAGRR